MGAELVKVIQELGRETHVCICGDTHEVVVLSRKFLGPVVEMREHNNGYEKRMTEVRRDAQGREYHQHITIDYTGNIFWLREDGRLYKPEYKSTYSKRGHRLA